MVTVYKNATELCKAHREPSLNYNYTDVVDILQQYYKFVYHQWHWWYKENNENYKGILTISERRLRGFLTISERRLLTQLKAAIQDIKNGPMNEFDRLILAPHVVMRTYNLFKSLQKSLEIYIENNQEVIK